jgi:dihydrodipicolinate synthase/N-acetylneuraminate lyase
MQLVVPALTFRHPDGTLDTAETERYAQRAAATWVHVFILSGTTTSGHLSTVAERAATIDVWTKAVDPSRVVACCWTSADLTEAHRRDVPTMAVLRNLDTERHALDFLTSLPRQSYLFSHPEFSPATLTPSLCRAAADAGRLPSGAKTSKVTTGQLTTLRAATGPEFTLWDGTARHIAASLAAGADGIVAAPLSHLPEPFPSPSVPELQQAVDQTQARLDQLTDRAARTQALFHLATTSHNQP